MRLHAKTALRSLRSLVNPFIEFIYPPTCFVCNALMGGHDSRVCEGCWSTIHPVDVNDRLLEEMRRRLRGTPGSRISDLTSLYYFEREGTLQSIIHQLKYGGMTSLGV